MAAASKQASYSGPIIDSDVHHTWRDDDELASYMDPRWRDYVGQDGVRVPLHPAQPTYPHITGRSRLENYPEGGGHPGSDYLLLRDQLLDAFDIRRAVLNYDIGLNAGMSNPYLAAALATAANRWSMEQWLEKDDRLCSAILVAPELPQEAVKEIERASQHDRMVTVLVVPNAMGKPFGHPHYHPIYEAAADAGLPISIHHGGEFSAGAAYLFGGGFPNTRFEFHTCSPEALMHHFVSFITHGVFEKYPSLRLLLIEGGVAWFPWLLTSLDARYSTLRQESPWVKQLPSEYVKGRVFLTTQPLELSPKPDQLLNLLELVDGIEDMLLFATDYPHWDADDPHYIARRLPKSWQTKMFFENAATFYGFKPDELNAVSPPATATATV